MDNQEKSECANHVAEKPNVRFGYRRCEDCGRWRPLDDRKIKVGGVTYTELEYAGKRRG